MKIEHLRYLLEIVSCKSFNKAAKNLYLNHQYLSRIISNLESELGVQILERNYKGISVTKKGAAIVKYAEEVIAKTDDLLGYLKTDTQKKFDKYHLTIYSLSTINSQLFTILHSFCERYPDISFHIEEKSMADIIDILCTSKDGLAIILLPPGIDQDNLPFPSCLQFDPICTGRYVAIAAPSNTFITSQKSTSLKGLLQQDLLIYNPSNDPNSAALALFVGLGKPQIKYSVGNLNTFYELLDIGDCVAIAFEHSLTASISNRYLHIPIRDNVKATFGALIHTEKKEDPIIAEFIMHLHHTYATNP